MNTALETMLKRYDATTQAERKSAFREIAQEVILCGLSRAGFFERSAFYGGTALRIFYGLDRYSEDMDFSLVEPDQAFSLTPYLQTVERECATWGLRLVAQEKKKGVDSAIRSAFLKGNTKEHLLKLFPEDAVLDAVASSEVLRIKLEIDTDPAPHATFERQYRLLPSPYEVRLYDEASLFAGKIHAVLCRQWQNRVKGRDFYDYVFYLSRQTPVNLLHLRAKLVQTGHLDTSEELSLSQVKAMLTARFKEVDFEQAKADVLPFLRDARKLDVWSSDFFCATVGMLEAAG